MSKTILRKVPDEDVYYNFEDFIELDKKDLLFVVTTILEVLETRNLSLLSKVLTMIKK